MLSLKAKSRELYLLFSVQLKERAPSDGTLWMEQAFKEVFEEER